MLVSLRHFLGWLVSVFRSREDLVLENLALRRQLLALHAQQPRRRLTAIQASSQSLAGAGGSEDHPVLDPPRANKRIKNALRKHPAKWENPTPKQLRISEMSLRYAWIAAWLARLGVVRFCLARLARGSPRLGWAAVSAFGFDTAAAAQRIVGEIRKLPVPILPVVRALWSQPKNFISLGQHVVALPVSAAQAAAVSSLRDLPVVVLSGEHHAAPYTQWQRDLAPLSSRGRHVVAIDSGHWIHLDHPEVVTRAICEVVAAEICQASFCPCRLTRLSE
jgi:pimeloyl-ACP methyl ester carboxylesterase